MKNVLKIIGAPALVVLVIFVVGAIYRGLVSDQTIVEAARSYASSWKVFVFAYLVLLVAHSMSKLSGRSRNRRQDD